MTLTMISFQEAIEVAKEQLSKYDVDKKEMSLSDVKDSGFYWDITIQYESNGDSVIRYSEPKRFQKTFSISKDCGYCWAISHQKSNLSEIF